MEKLDTGLVLQLHLLVAERSGGDPGLRDLETLNGALLSAFQTFGGVELYETDIDKIVHICYSVISTHPFVDGNKRTGVLLLLLLLKLCGISHTLTSADVVKIGLSVAASEMNEGELSEYLRARLA